MSQKKLPSINNAHDSETRNIINELIRLFNGMGYTYNESLSKAHNILNEAKKTNNMNKDVQRQLDTIILENGNSEAEVVQARNGLPLLKDRLNKTDDALDKTTKKIENRIGGLHPFRMSNVKEKVITNSEPRVLDVFSGYVWADNVDGQILKRPQQGGEWLVHTIRPIAAQLLRLIPTGNNEVLLLTDKFIYSSKNFYDPENISWEQRLTANDETHFMQWGIDGYDNKFITTTYRSARIGSRYAWISLDYGVSWKIVYDSVEKHGAAANESHMHAVCYDRWSDRFYLSEGHGTAIAGVYISENDGKTWYTNANLKQNPSPTTLTATPDGIVCGTDNEEDGIFGIVRQSNIKDEALVKVWSWKTGKRGLAGFAQRGFYDENSGLVYIAFRSDFADVKPIVAAGTVFSGGEVFEWDLNVTAQDRIVNIVIPNKNEALFYGRSNGSTVQHSFTATITPPGAKVDTDEGNLTGIKRASGDSIALGYLADAPNIRSVVIGHNSSASSQDDIVIGHNSTIVAANSIVIGNGTKSGSSSVVIGDRSEESGGQSILIGAYSKNLGGGQAVVIGESATGSLISVAIGYQASTTSQSVALGYKAKTTVSRGVALGYEAEAQSDSVALGYQTKTTQGSQVNIGNRHLELGQRNGGTDRVPNGKARIFAIEENGTTKLCVRMGYNNIVLAELTH